MTFRLNSEGRICMETTRGDVTLCAETAGKWRDLYAQAHDAAMHAGDVMAAREARRHFLDLDLLLDPPARIPVLAPITAQVRQLDPSIWGDAA